MARARGRARGAPLARKRLNTAFAVLSLPIALGLVELGLRVMRGGHAHLPIYAPGAPPSLAPDRAVVGLLGTRRYHVETDARGFRVPSALEGTLLLGDSLAFGLGLDGEHTLAARCTARGHPTMNAAVPGSSAIDALDRGDALGGASFLVVLNPWDDHLGPTDAEVVNGWLVSREGPGWGRTFLASPFASWQLPHDVFRIATMLRREAPAGIGFARVGERIRAFLDGHPDTRVLWGGYPADVMPDGRVVEALREEVGVEMMLLDLHDAWIDGDLHWSAEGVEQVAAQVCR